MMQPLTRHKFLSSDEYSKLLHVIDVRKVTDRRNTLILLVSIHTGARPTEVLATTVKDLDQEHGTIYIKGLKGSRSRELPLPKALFSNLYNFTSGKAPDDRIFDIALRTYQAIWEDYRPAKKGVRCLRHTFAIRLYERTKDVRLVQMALGHKNLNTTQIYVDYVYNQEELKKLLL